ncbi:MAG TPA: DUF1579 family protein [Candidatus Angelobacter sp.]
MKKASKKTTLTLAAVMLAAIIASAQNPPGPPKPGPEVEKLKYFLGNWKQSLEVKPGPMGPGGKGTETVHAEWLPGGFFIVIHGAADMGAMGKFTTTAFLGYNTEDKVYTYDEFASTGEHTVAKGTVEGDTWTWTSVSKEGGKTMNGRFIEKIASPNSYDLKFEASMDGGASYATMLEGKATKAGGAAAAKPASAGKASAATAKPPSAGAGAEKPPQQ